MADKARRAPISLKGAHRNGENKIGKVTPKHPLFFGGFRGLDEVAAGTKANPIANEQESAEGPQRFSANFLAK